MTQINRSLVDVKLTLAYLAEQPIMHTEETIGNISKLKQMRVIYNGKPVSVPALSGNSFRGQLRDILADELCSRLSIQGEQLLRFDSNETYSILYSGGALSERSTSGGLLKDFVEHLPSMRLMGAAFGNVMLPSKLAMTHIVPCAEETQEILQSKYTTLEDGLVPAPTEWPSARNLLFNAGPLTRKDDRRDRTRQRFVDPGMFEEIELENGANGEAGQQDPQQMIYYVECIPAGTWLLQQLYSKFPLDWLELGCLFGGLNTFLSQPALGGRSSAGYGQVHVQLRGTVDTESVQWPTGWSGAIKDAVNMYENYLIEKREEILKALTVQTEEVKE